MSNERQFDNIDNKIKKALESGEHAFNEEAWAKMEAMLDKEDKKRRPILWLWLLPVLFIGTVMFIKFSGDTTSNSSTGLGNLVEKENTLTEKNKEIIANQENKATSKNDDESDKVVEKDVSGTINKAGITTVESTSSPVKSFSPVNTKEARLTQHINPVDNVSEAISDHKHKPTRNKRPVNAATEADMINNTTLQPSTIHTEKIEEGKAGTTSLITKTSGAENGNSDSGISLLTVPVSDSSLAQPQTVLEQTNNKLQSNNTSVANNKKKVSFTPKFYLLGSVGADAGSVRLLSFKNSTVVAKYGLGIGYQFSRHLSIQTGFYIASKKYSAGTGDYHVKPGSYWDTYKITSVDAVCKVYDIPLSLRYDLTTKGSVKYYALAGLSSYIMKKEDYNYYYLRWGAPAEKHYSYTGNRHLFSNLNFSFGLEKKLSGKLSLLLEPSVSVPIAGVGDGKVKLYSTSFTAGLKYLPFKK